MRLATVTAMSGRHAEPQRLLRSSGPEHLFSHEEAIATAWVRAAEGAPSGAIRGLVTCADQARAANLPARELMCLQAATQLGDVSRAQRVVELASIVQGPRGGVVVAHATALAAREGAALLDAAARYEAFGDRIAAGDAAAQVRFCVVAPGGAAPR